MTKENEKFLEYFEKAYYKYVLPRILCQPDDGDDQLSETDAIKKMINIPTKHLWLLDTSLRTGLDREEDKTHLLKDKIKTILID